MKDRNYLINAYNATSTEDSRGNIETYQKWLEKQLLSRIEELEQLRICAVSCHRGQCCPNPDCKSKNIKHEEKYSYCEDCRRRFNGQHCN